MPTRQNVLPSTGLVLPQVGHWVDEADAPHYAGVEGIFDLPVNLVRSGSGWVFQSSLNSISHIAKRIVVKDEIPPSDP